MSELNKKVQDAIKVLKMAETAASMKNPTIVSIEERNGYGRQIVDNQVEIGYSSGKDSDVIAHLAGMAGIRHVIIRKDTTVDPSYSNAHAREKGAIIIKPKQTFFEIIRNAGFPTDQRRHCCKYLKEYKVLSTSVLGIRRCESQSRKERYTEPTMCRIYGKKENHVDVFLPILEWTDEDVIEFVKQEHIKCHPLYYDEKGNFCADRRLGCYACPLKSRKQQVADFKKNPRFLREWIRNGIVWWNKPHTDRFKSGEKFETIYDTFYNNVFCDSYEEYLYKTRGMFGRVDVKKLLEDYFKIDLP